MEVRTTSPLVRSQMYEDVRQLLRPGFLSHPVKINGCPVVLRTLTQDDLFLLRHRAGENYGKDWQNWVIATSIWMLEGQVTVGDPNIQYLIYERIKALPRMFREDLFSVFTALMNRTSKAMDNLEAFFYEDESRHLWISEGMSMLERPPFMGAPVLALNGIQKTWISYNRYEDKRGERKFWWGLSKFIVQPHAPKGITKLNNSEKKEEELEKKRRQRVMDLAYWRFRGVISDAEEQRTKVLKDPGEVVAAETVEDLQQEMANWVAGKKDPHDKVIDFVKAKIKGDVESRRQSEEDRIAAIQNQLEEEELDEPAFMPLMGEAAEAIKRRLSGPKAPPRVYAGQAAHNSAYEKYIRHNPDVGALVVDEKGYVQNAVAPKATPEELLEMLTAPKDGEGKPGDSLGQQVKIRASEQQGSKE